MLEGLFYFGTTLAILGVATLISYRIAKYLESQ